MKDIMKMSGANISEAYGRATYLLKTQLADADKQAEKLRNKARTIQQELKKTGVKFGDTSSNLKTNKKPPNPHNLQLSLLYVNPFMALHYLMSKLFSLIL